ncbi:MAG: hypothetical protein WC869_14085 [Phycisphaerae bacterium]|jgi:hypothetical protein
MALAFFRRRQKMVMIIMAILMVSFLVGFQGLSSLTEGKHGKQSLGATKYGNITVDDLELADSDLRLLNYLNQNDLDFQAMIASSSRPEMSYALLLKEAQKSGVAVGTEDENAFLKQRGLEGANLQAYLTQLRTIFGEGLNESTLRAAARRWSTIGKFYMQSAVMTPASEQTIIHLFRDLNEKIDLRTVTLKAEDFLKEVAEPNDQAITAQFNAYREALKGDPNKDNPFGFGYKQPDRARILYLLVRQDVIERVSRPSEESVRAFYRQNASKMVRKVPVASSQPAEAGKGAKTTQPASAPTEFKTEQMTFAQAKPLIIEQMSAAVARQKVEEVLGRAETLIRDYATSTEATKLNAYQWTRARMMLPADAALGQKIQDLNIEGQTLEKAMAVLAEKANLNAIAFPWTSQGDNVLDPNVKVTLKAESLTLQEALDKVATQIKWPKLHWAMFTGFEGVLFSVAQDGGVDFGPVSVKETPLMDYEAMSLDPVLSTAASMAEEPLPQVVFTSPAFAQGRKGGSSVKVGEDGPRMTVKASGGGRLLWRLMQAELSSAPRNISDIEGLRDLVIKDLKLQAAFDLALKRAQELAAQASKSSLAAAAKAGKFTTSETGLIPRITLSSRLEQLFMYAQMTGRMPTRNMAVEQPYESTYSQVPGLELGNHARDFMDAAFALAPANPEPPYSDTPPAVGVAPLPSIKEVVVMQRIGYQPAVQKALGEAAPKLSSQLEENQRWLNRMQWFNYGNLVKRLDYKDPRGQEK